MCIYSRCCRLDGWSVLSENLICGASWRCRRDGRLQLFGSYGDDSSCFGISVSGVVQIYNEDDGYGKAGICDGGKVYRIHGNYTGRNGTANLALVLLFAGTNAVNLAGGMVLCLYIYDRKSTEEIYAGCFG